LCSLLKKEQEFDEIMRPKMVILILGIGVGLVAAVVLLKGLTGGRAGDVGGQPPAVEASAEPPPAKAVQKVQVNPSSTNAVAGSEEMRAAAVGKELDAIQELLGEADGSNNSTIISALIDKVTNPEKEVRSAALDALKQLNDTNAVPGLEKAVEAIKDPRAKVDVMDTIDYLKLPNVMPDVQPADVDTNVPDAATINPNMQMNPNFLHKGGREGRQAAPRPGRNGRQAAPPNAPAGQAQ
jgi:hypothetical protein